MGAPPVKTAEEMNATLQSPRVLEVGPAWGNAGWRVWRVRTDDAAAPGSSRAQFLERWGLDRAGWNNFWVEADEAPWAGRLRYSTPTGEQPPHPTDAMVEIVPAPPPNEWRPFNAHVVER